MPIPLYENDRYVGEVEVDYVLANESRMKVVRNKRKNVVRAYLKSLSAHAVPLLSRKKTGSFEQELTCGHVWALRGVRGSGR